MRNKKGIPWINLGLLLIAAALLLAAYNINEERKAGESTLEASDYLEDLMPTDGSKEGETAAETEVPDYVLDPDKEMPVKIIDGQEFIGVLEIPSLKLKLSIMNQWSYPKLKKSPCRYRGSVYKGDLVIAAHNYRTHFGRIKNLSEGDEVIFTDMDGNTFHYEVALLEILAPNAVVEMESSEWDLTLFTCTLGGASRVTVRCKRTDNEEYFPLALSDSSSTKESEAG